MPSVPFLDAQLGIGQRIHDVTRNAGDKTALRFLSSDGADTTMSFAELGIRASSIARQLVARRATGERVLLLLPPGLQYVAALLGCLFSGAVGVPAYPPRFNRRTRRLEIIARDSQSKFIIGEETAKRQLVRKPDEAPTLASIEWITCFEATDPDFGNETSEPYVFDSQALALIQYTSGSTADPKGVCLTHADLEHQCIQLIANGRFDAGDKCVSWLPPYHDMGLIGALLTPLCLSAEAILMSPFAFLQRPISWLQAIGRYRATASAAPNFAYELCARRISDEQLGELDLSSWRFACCGAERVRPETLERFSHRFEPVGFQAKAFTPCYGLAEATLAVSMGQTNAKPADLTLDRDALGRGVVQSAVSNGHAVRLVSSGCSLPGLQLKIVDPATLTPCPTGTVGEIWVAGGGIATGYWNRPELTAATFQARVPGSDVNYLRTGDLGFIKGDELYVTGRCKDLVILAGSNYYPEDIENAVSLSHPGLHAGGCAAFGIELDNDEALVVVQEIAMSSVSDSSTIEASIREAVHASHGIALYDVVLVAPGAVPKTSSGKIQRGKSRDMYLGHEFKVLNARPAPATPLDVDGQADETRIASLMAELLGVGHIGPGENFFNLGGHSLLALQLTSRIRDQFGVDIPVGDVFRAPTARELARLVRGSQELAPVPIQVPTATEGEPLLSFSQERMWFLHELEPQSAAYNVAGALQIDGPLDYECFTRAFNEILLRHSALRTRFALNGALATPLIVPAPRLEIPAIDLSGDTDPHLSAISAASHLAALPFDIASDLLVRVQLYRLGPECHVVAASMQHTVTDAWSMGLILSDVLTFYHAFRLNENLPAPRQGMTYQDYARWQRQHLSESVIQRELTFWKAELVGAEPLLLPTRAHFARPHSSQGGFIPISLTDGLMTSLRDFGATEGATLFMVMLAAFDALLYRYSGQTDIIVGVPVANRNESVAEEFVGTFVNTLAMRARLDPTRPFLELLRSVRDKSVEYLAHQEVPFERVVSELEVMRSPGAVPLVQVMFDFQNTPMPSQHSGPLKLQQIPISRGAAQFDLSLVAFDSALGHCAGVEFNTGALDESLVRKFAEHYVAVLEQLVVDPSQNIDDFDLVSETERQEILGSCRNAGVRTQPHLDLLDRVREHASVAPTSIALADVGHSVCYRDLSNRVDALASELAVRGLVPGTRAAILLERGVSLVVALLAVMRCGATYVPLDPHYPKARLAYVLGDCAPKLVLTEQAFEALLPEEVAASAIVQLDHLASCSDGNTEPPLITSADDSAAYVLYTSGSTGKPKGVEISKSALHNFLYSMAHTPGITRDDKLLSITTIAFDIAGLELLLPLLVGATVFIAPSEAIANGHELLKLMQRVQPTVMQGTPATWTMLLDAGFAGSQDLRILCGGEALSADLAERLLPRCCALWNMYGPTETTIWSAVHRVTSGENPVPIGRPIDATSIYILNPKNRLCPVGVIGEICIGGAGVANGYLNRSELTQARFVTDPFAESKGGRMYRTGDLGRLRRDGLLECAGRMDHQIKVRGFRIEPGEVEGAIRSITGLHDVLVVAHTFKPGDTRLIAYLAGSNESVPDATLRHQLKSSLPDYMIPSVFVRLEAFPLTPNGKVNRAALPPPDATHIQAETAAIGPRDAWEARLVPIFREILGRSNVGINDDFFSMGGHSLLAVKLVAGVEQEFGIRLPLAVIFETSSIAGLAQYIRSLREVSTRPPPFEEAVEPHIDVSYGLGTLEGYEHLTLIRQGGTDAPLFCIHGAGGHVLNFAPLARRMDERRPIYGLQASGLDGRTPTNMDLEATASRYASEIRRLQPSGPYFILGYCLGGLIALEVASALRSSGETVSFLGLVNTHHPGIHVSLQRVQRFWQRLKQNKPSFIWQWLLHKGRLLWEALVRTIAILVSEWFSRPVPIQHRDYWLTRLSMRAAKGHQLSRYSGRVVLFSAKEDYLLTFLASDLGWRAHAGDTLVVHEVPGNHSSILHEPQVIQLSQLLEQELAHGDGSMGIVAAAPTPALNSLPLARRSTT